MLTLLHLFNALLMAAFAVHPGMPTGGRIVFGIAAVAFWARGFYLSGRG